ncbi:fimbrial protein [Burkholderia diffusa]|uniref:fimbrial protein n=1 Tax=Burkholderia diffusa TaxID=488732 RepID=UPI0009C048B7|nr:fimbrial protein [Burkholderia diffusa]
MSRIRKTLLAAVTFVLFGGPGAVHAAIKCDWTQYSPGTWSIMSPVDTWKVGDVLSTMDVLFKTQLSLTGGSRGEFITSGFWVEDYAGDMNYDSAHQAVVTNVPEVGIRIMPIFWNRPLPVKAYGGSLGHIGESDGSLQLTETYTGESGSAPVGLAWLRYELVLLKPLTNIPPTGLNVTTSRLKYRFESRRIFGALINNKECNVYQGTSLLGLGGALPPIKPPPTPTCKLDTPRIGVALPAVNIRTLNDSGASMPGLKVFNIRLSDCSNNAKPIIALIDAQNTANTGPNLALKSTSTASGVALRIRNGRTNTDIPFGRNNTFSMGAPVGGTVVLPLQAYYVRTGGALRAGTVAADANFSVTFQ